MKDTEKILIGIVFILVIAALVLTFTPGAVPGPEPEPDTSAARELFTKVAMVGYGQDNYYYSYQETFNDFTTTYGLLMKPGNESMISIETMLSTKQIYFLENDTILCMQYLGQEACTSVHNDTDVDSYLKMLKHQFFDDRQIEQTVTDMEYFELYGYITFSPETSVKIVDGKECIEFQYMFDFTNITIYEAARFGIGATTPKQFHYTACVDNVTGDVYEKHVEYRQGGVDYTSDFRLLGSEWGTSREVDAPQNLTGDAVQLLKDEKQHQNTLSACYAEEGDERDRCVALLALNLRDREMCELAGGRRDRCLVSLVPFVKDDTICPTIVDMSFRDDCYIEMAGVTGDSSFCGEMANASKMDFCLNVSASAKPVEPWDPEIPGNDTNMTGDGSDVDDFLREIYESTLENDTNVTE